MEEGGGGGGGGGYIGGREELGRGKSRRGGGRREEGKRGRYGEEGHRCQQKGTVPLPVQNVPLKLVDCDVV